MPLYEYVCQACNERFEHLVRSRDDAATVRCPACASAAVERAFSTFATGGGRQDSTSAPACGPVG